MKNFALQCLCVLSLLLACSGAWSQKVMLPGSWDLTSDSEVTNKTGQTGTAQKKTTVCLTKATLAKDVYLDPKFELANKVAFGGKCAVFDFQRQGNRASWTLSCAMPRNIKLSVSYKNDVSANELISEVDQTLVNDPRYSAILTKIKGVHMGECAIVDKNVQ
jgi:Protein of unknown function (DUF3617)